MSFRILLGAALLTIPLAAATNPLDDDAGSGGDAGDDIEDALPVAPGSYSGRLTRDVDRQDVYGFDASAGRLLQIRVDEPGGDMFAIHGWVADSAGNGWDSFGVGEPYEILLGIDGPHFLKLSMSSSKTSVSYRLQFSLVDPAFHYIAHVEEAATTREFLVPQGVAARAAVTVIYNDGEFQPTGSMLAFVQTNRMGFGLLGNDPGLGYNIATEPSLVPAQETPDLPGVDQGEGGTVASLGTDGTEQLPIRIVTGLDGPMFEIWIRIHASAPLDILEGTGRLEIWDGRDAALEAEAPGVHVAGSASHAWDVEGPFIGFASPGTNPATVHGPDGQEVPPKPGCACWDFLDPSHGRWTFELAAQADLVNAHQQFLFGAHVPWLGVFPPWPPYPA